MAISRLSQKNKMRAKNFPNESFQARMLEYRDVVAEDLKNAIFVNGTPLWYFRKDSHGSATCTCKKHSPSGNDAPRPIPGSNWATQAKHTVDTAAIPEEGLPQFTQVDVDAQYSGVVELDFAQTMMWEHKEEFNGAPPDNKPNANAHEIFPTDDNFGELEPESKDDNGSVGAERHMRAACGVCNGSFVVDGYFLLGHDRKVLETARVSRIEGYSVDRNAAPYVFERELEEGFVEFDYFIPAIFGQVYFGVYANTVPISDFQLTVNDEAFNLQTLNKYAGKDVKIKVSKAKSFTHAVLVMQLCKEPLRGDFPQDSKPKNFGQFRVLTNQQIHVSNDVVNPGEGDVVLKLTTGEVFKVSDVDSFKAADTVAIGWTLNSSLVQENQATTLVMTQLFEL